MGKFTSLLKLRPFIRKYRLLFWTGLIGLLASSFIANPIPRLVGTIMDRILVTNKSYAEFYRYIGIILFLYISRYLVSVFSKYMFSRINNLVVNELRYSVVKKVMDLKMSYLSKTEKGYVQSRIGECGSVGSIFSPAIISIMLSVVDAILAIITMFYLNYKLAFLAVFLTPLFFLSSRASTKGFMKNTHEMLESSAILNGESFEIINGIEEIKVLNGKEFHLNRFDVKLRQLIKNSIKMNKSMLLFMENITLINNIGSLLLLFISGLLILKGQFTIGLYTTFSLYMIKVFASTQGIATIGTTIKPVCLNIERLYELLDMEDENSGRNRHLEDKIKTIKLDDLSFSYDINGKTVLDSINFEIHNGEKIIIKGENGSGKSTLIKILLGLYNPTTGRLLYNDFDASLVDTIDIRKRIGIVSQSTFLFKGTVLDNILYGMVDKNREDAEKLILEFKLDGYFNRLSKGLDTEIMQNTAGVSGGQAQIIAFIRAMLAKKEILIFDEPISNVDAETREIVLNILKTRDFDGILIIVSHIAEGMDFINRTIEI
jgi:ABC-type bacteriocin/lantibiotic exporters, contain an N-terminal double-glycine peptidase domain